MTFSPLHSPLIPPALKPGDTIGVVSPAWGGLGLFPERVARGVRQLEALGFRVRFGEHAFGDQGSVSGTAADRAADLHAMFADPDVRVVLAAIGGDHANQLLPLLDFDLIRANPKIFMGYSDITVLNLALLTGAGLGAFDGPAFLTDFAEYPALDAFTRDAFTRVVMTPEPAGALPVAAAWTDEFLDWATPESSTRARIMHPSGGPVVVRGGVAEGRLLGGCLESLDHLRGTRFWPDWRGALLFLESSEEKPSPARWDSMLMDYENMGIFDRIAGLLVGRPYGYNDEEKRELHGVLRERTARFGFPVLAELDFGHTSPRWTLPLGVRARLDADQGRVALLEAAVR